MNVQCVNSDRISSLPQNIIENILTLIPLREAVRTSILSRNWRFCWTGMPKLVLDHELVELSSTCRQLSDYKHANAILCILSQLTGSILEFNLDVSIIDTVLEFDRLFDLIISYLSTGNTVKKLMLRFSGFNYKYKLPSAFLLLQGLEYLELENCDFELFSTLNGFSRLTSLCCNDVENVRDVFQRFLSGCPLLTDVTLMGELQYADFTFVELLQCVPSIRTLHIEGSWMEHLSAGGMPMNFPTTAAHLKDLYMDVYFNVQDEISSTFHLIRNSPNLEKIVLSVHEQFDVSPISMKFLDLHDYRGFNLDHLEYFEMENFGNSPSEMELLKLIMAKSPVLKKVRLKLTFRVSVDEELEIRRLPRASSSAMLIIKRYRC